MEITGQFKAITNIRSGSHRPGAVLGLGGTKRNRHKSCFKTHSLDNGSVWHWKSQWFSSIEKGQVLFFLIVSVTTTIASNFHCCSLLLLLLLLSLQSCPTLCDPIDGSPPGSSVHGIFQARVLEWVVIAFSGSLLLVPTNFMLGLL